MLVVQVEKEIVDENAAFIKDSIALGRGGGGRIWVWMVCNQHLFDYSCMLLNSTTADPVHARL